MNKVLFLILSTLISLSLFSQKQNQMNKLEDVSMFPKAEKGMRQYVINLDTKENEENYKVQILISMKSKVDKCNQHNLTGSFEKYILKGYGYDYYTFNSKGTIMSTRMGCVDNELVEKSVYSYPGDLIRYNSRMPIVIYVPDGMDVSYKLWEADEKEYQATAKQ